MRARPLRSTVLAAALLAAPLTAQSTLEVIGSRSLQIPPVKAAQATVDFSIPVRWGGPANARRLLPVLEVNLGGEPREISAFRFLLRPDPITKEPSLLARVDLKKAATAGTYAVKVQPPRPAAGAALPAPLEFSFVRPAAEVRIDTPIRLERVVYLPGLSTLAPGSVMITENSSRSPVLLETSRWVAELRGADGKPARGRLRFTLPSSIEAWKQGRAAVEVLSAPALGRSSGTLTLRSEQLAARSVDFPLEIASRVSLFWLLAALAGSIALGYLTRTRIDERRKRLQAALAVERQRGRLQDLLGVAVDEGLKARLAQILDALHDAERAAGPDVEAIVAAANQAKADAEAAVAQADQKRATLQGRIGEWRLALGPAGAQPRGLEEIIRGLLLDLKAQEKLLAQGHLVRVEAFLEEEPQKVQGLREVLEAWLDRLDSALDRAGAWPDTRFAAIAAEIGQTAVELRTNLGAADTLEALGPVLTRSAALAGRVRGLRSAGVDSLLFLARNLREDLGGLKDDALKTVLDDLTLAERQVEAARDRSSADDLRELAEALHRLRETIEAALLAAYRPTRKQGDPPEPAGLAEATYEAVLRDVLLRRQPPVQDSEERPLGEGPAASPPAGPAARERPLFAEALEAPRRPVWTVALEVPDRVVVGREAALLLRVKAPAGQPAPVVTVRWSVGGGAAQQGIPGDLGWSFTPRRPGPVVVRAEAVADSGETAAAEARLLVLPADGFAAIPVLTERLRRDERIQSIVSGFLIAAAGYAMFSGAFVGTFQDFLAAAFWGYTVDLGVARVREMAAPLLARQPFPPAS